MAGRARRARTFLFPRRENSAASSSACTPNRSPAAHRSPSRCRALRRCPPGRRSCTRPFASNPLPLIQHCRNLVPRRDSLLFSNQVWRAPCRSTSLPRARWPRVFRAIRQAQSAFRSPPPSWLAPRASRKCPSPRPWFVRPCRRLAREYRVQVRSILQVPRYSAASSVQLLRATVSAGRKSLRPSRPRTEYLPPRISTSSTSPARAFRQSIRLEQNESHPCRVRARSNAARGTP